MRILLLLTALFALSGCNPNEPSDSLSQRQCRERAAEINAYWVQRHPSDKADLEKEIDALLGDSDCGAITPWRMRKVFHDMMEFKGNR